MEVGVAVAGLEFKQFNFGLSGNLSRTLRCTSYYHILCNNKTMAFVDWDLSSIPDMVRKYCQCAGIGCWALLLEKEVGKKFSFA